MPPMTSRDLQTPEPGLSFSAAASRGLFVGVNRFDDQNLAPLSYAVDDAVDLAFLFSYELQLVAAGNVTLALSGSPEKPETQDKLAWLKEAKAVFCEPMASELQRRVWALSHEVGREGLLVLSFATHGFNDDSKDLIAGKDAWPLRATSGSILVQDLLSDVTASASPRRLLLLDTCRSRFRRGARGVDGEGMTPSFAATISRATGTCVINSTTLGGLSYEDPQSHNGVFTSAIVRGLREGAVGDARGFVTVDTLVDYVNDEVVSWLCAQQGFEPGAGRGITLQEDVAIRSLPLAASGEEAVAARRDRLMRALSIQRLRRHLGGNLERRQLDELERIACQPSPLTPEQAALLEAAAALDGTQETERVFRSEYERQCAASPHDLFRGGLALMYGLRGKVDLPAAQERFIAAAKAASPVYPLWVTYLRAQGKCLLRRDVGPDFRIGAADLESLQVDARRGDRDAALVLGFCLADGVGVPADHEKAMVLFTRAAQDQDPVALNALGSMHDNAGHRQEAARLYRTAADLGNARAMCNLAVCFESGLGVPEDMPTACGWYRKAADRGFAPAMTSLGKIYEFGRETAVDFHAARDWYERSAQAGDGDGLTDLGWLHHGGKGGPVDRAKAIACFEKAAEMGSTFGMRSLAAVFADGEDVPKDFGRALALWRQAATLGDSLAMKDLGEIYDKGWGDAADSRLAVAWYEKAVARRDGEAAWRLAEIYREGRGVQKDPQEVIRLARLAGELGYVPPAKKKGLDKRTIQGDQE
jgi:TPR repeat protein